MSADERGSGSASDKDILDAELASYALNALTEDARVAVERELATSPDLRAELHVYRETVAALSSIVGSSQPSPALRSGILASISGAMQVPPRVSAGGSVDSTAEPTSELIPTRAAARPGAERARMRWFVRPAIALGSVAAAACLVLAGVVIGAGGVGSPAAPEAAATTGASDDSVALASILAASDATSATAKLTGGATATVYASASLKRSAIVWKNLPALPKSKTYEAWYITSTAVPAGTFEASGTTAYEVLDGDMPAKASVGITVEKAGGASTPDLDTLLGTITTA